MDRFQRETREIGTQRAPGHLPHDAGRDVRQRIAALTKPFDLFL